MTETVPEEKLPTMKDLAKFPENMICADCDAKGPDWASINLGIFICIKCAGIHRKIGVHHSKVRSLPLDTTCWDAEQIKFMISIGNVRARKQFELNAPCYYMKPSSKCTSNVVRDYWIRAKYVQKEFIEQEGGDQSHVNNLINFSMPEHGVMGWLQKQNEKNVWQKRWFVLHRQYLQYYKDPTDSYPKGKLVITDASLKIPDDEAAEFKHSFELQFTNRVYPLKADTEEELFKWVHAIKRAQIFFNHVKQPADLEVKTSSQTEVEKLPYNKLGSPDLVGYVTKQGGAFKTWKRRFCVLIGLTIHYFKQKPLDEEKECAEGYILLEGCDIGVLPDGSKRKFCLSLTTVARTYFLQTETEEEMQKWLKAVKAALATSETSSSTLVNFKDEELVKKVIADKTS